MKISRELPQFHNKKAILIVSGGERAFFYLARDSFLKRLGATEELSVHYSDREGFFERRGLGRILGSGSVYEKKEDEREKRFIKKVLKKLRELDKTHGFDEIYLFSPGYLQKRFIVEMRLDERRRLSGYYDQNYATEHPFFLLKKIKTEREKIVGKKVPLDPEARKILKKYDLIHK